jgi:hypothetical protein
VTAAFSTSSATFQRFHPLTGNPDGDIVLATLPVMKFAWAVQRTIDTHPVLSRIYGMLCLRGVIMRSGLIVFLLASSFSLALAIESGPETASKVAVGIARGAVAGVTSVPADVQSRLLLQQVVSKEGRESPRVQDD